MIKYNFNFPIIPTAIAKWTKKKTKIKQTKKEMPPLEKCLNPKRKIVYIKY